MIAKKLSLLVLLAIANVQASSQKNEDLKRTTSGHDARIGNPVDRPTKCKLCNESITEYFRENSLHHRFNGQVTFEEYLSYAMRSMKLTAGYDNDLHRYDRDQDLIDSFARHLTYADDLSYMRSHIESAERSLLGDQSELTLIENERNQNTCGQQLRILLRESRRLFTNYTSFAHSKELSLIDYIDSFGAAPQPQLMMANVGWFGSHEQCTSSTPIEGARARYCIANYQSPELAAERIGKEQSSRPGTGGESIKLGICLPDSCNSVSILRHSRAIDSLVKLVRLNRLPFSEYQLTHLFCLPDEDSPLRQFSLSAKIFIVTLSGWLTVVAYYSIKYEFMLINNRSNQPSKQMQVFAIRLSLSKLFASGDRKFPPRTSSVVKEAKLAPAGGNDSGRESGTEASASASDSDSASSRQSAGKLGTRTANVLQNFHQSALATGPKVSPSFPRSRSSISISQRIDGFEVTARTNQPPSKTPAIDLGVIDGIKVLSMVWLIGAHTLLFFIRAIANGRDFWTIVRDARFITFIAGIFPVDTFFTVTGILTGFLKFNKNDGAAMGSTKYWIEAFVHRYLRFMPMYLIIFWYTRDVSEYIGSGPQWDYATAETSLRSICKRESASVPLLFLANYKPIVDHCVKPAWYLANDYQYLLMTPIFVLFLMKSTRLGYGLIITSVLSSLVMQFLTVFNSQDFTDFGALVNFEPMFATYVLKDLWRLYVLPYNRIAPYLIGLLTGHLMYQVNKTAKEKHAASITSKLVSSVSSDSLVSTGTSLARSADNILIQTSTKQTETVSLGRLLNYTCSRIWLPVLMLSSIVYMPVATKLATIRGDLQCRIGASALMGLMRLFWSLACARLIYICATRHFQDNANLDQNFVIRFLASDKWKPWSKIGLSALLIQWEIISYLAQTQSNLPQMTFSFTIAVVLLCIVSTYSLAVLIYLTIEYPLSQIEQLYIHPTLFKSSKRV